MEHIKPYKVLLFVLLVLLILYPIVHFAPEDGYTIFGHKIRFLTLNSLIHPKKQEKKNIDNIVKGIDTTGIDEGINRFNGRSNGTLGAPAGGELSTSSSTTIHLNDNAKNNLYQFFEMLKNVAEKQDKISIFHYGDSQIEGDRMTAYIRQRIQNQFGGSGTGLIPAVNVYPTMSFVQTYSENFMRYTNFWGDKLPNRKYGAMLSAAMFKVDTTKTQAGEPTSAWIEIEASKSAYARAKEFSQITCYYNSCTSPCWVKIYQNGKVIHDDSLVTDGAAHEIKLSFPSKPGKLKYVFSSKKSPVFTGFSMEGDYGVSVHNIAMRGSSGTQFGDGDQALFRKMHADLNTKLVMLQFGGNSVPGIKDSAMVRGYVKRFKGNIANVQKNIPGAAIIVIGPSDMSQLKDGIFETYKFLPYLVEQMKKGALDMGCGYYDVYGAMGGKNSMPSWVEQGLAGKDYIHFSPKGASFMSQLFYDAFIAEYAKWEEEKSGAKSGEE